MREFIAKVEGGKLPRFVSEAVRALLRKKQEGLVKVTIEDYKPGKSNSQNNYYWKVLVGGVQNRLSEMGNTVTREHVHEYIKRKVCPDLCEYTKEVILDGGEIDSITAYSTKHLSTEKHSELAERVRMWAAQQGVQLPMPNEAND